MTGPALYSRFLDLLNGKHPIGWFANKRKLFKPPISERWGKQLRKLFKIPL